PDRVAELESRARLYRDVLGYDGVEFFDRARLEHEGHLTGVSANGALWFRDVFGLHPLRYVRGLARAAARRGAVLHDRTRVLAWSREGHGHRLATDAGTVRARQVIVATNGYTSERLHPYFAGRLLPTTSNIVVTRPLTEAEWRGTGMLRSQCYS